MSNGVIVDNSKKKLSELTRLEAEKESQRRAAQTQEEIEAMGQTSDLKARPDVQRWFDQMEALEKGYRDEAYEILIGLRKNTLEYNNFLLAVLGRFIEQEDIPKRFKIFTKADKKGVILYLVGTSYYKAFASCGIPPYDYHACKVLAMQLANTTAKLSGYVRESEGGILIPDAEDLKKYNGRTS